MGNMNDTARFSNGTLINILLIVFQGGFFIYAFATVFYILFVIIAFAIGDSTFPTDFPVMFSLSDKGAINFPDQLGTLNFSMQQGMGIIGAENLPKGFVALYGIIDVLGVTCILLSLKLTIAILEAVKEGGFLIVENAKRLRKIAFLGIAMFLFNRLATVVSASYFSDKIQYSGIDFSSVNLYTFFNVQSIFYSLFLLVIAEAFRIGALLKEESDLTI